MESTEEIRYDLHTGLPGGKIFSRLKITKP
jgi:hypothetical protein